MRKDPLVVEEHYHIYNRGTDKKSIFQDKIDLERFFQSLIEFNSSEPIGSIYLNAMPSNQLRRPTSQLVEIVAYCLNPNHYHLLLKQLTDNGISEFMKRLGGGYTRYFNDRHKRTGSLFQGRFKSNLVDSNEYLLHLSAYINLNNRTYGNKQLTKSSWQEYTNKNDKGICRKKIILEQFKKRSDYISFAESSWQDILNRKKLLNELELMGIPIILP